MSPDVIQTNRINLKYVRYYNMEIITFRHENEGEMKWINLMLAIDW